MKNKLYSCTVLALMLMTSISCKRKFDIPPLKHVTDGARISIANLKARYITDLSYTFSGDTNLYCVVIADEVSGNLYKELFVSDASGALHVKLTSSGSLFVGDSIRIHLDHVLLNASSGLIQLDSVDAAKHIVKLASGLNPQPETMSLAQLLANTSATNPAQSRLIQLTGVEFLPACRNQPYANAGTKASGQYTLQDCSGNQILLRTSGYAYFADAHTPTGNGSITAILSQFYTTPQLVLRNPAEVNMNGKLCTIVQPTVAATVSYLSKNFNDNSIISGGWSLQNVTGIVNWSTSSKGSSATPYGQISNYLSSTSIACETWLISPALSLATATNPVLSFRNAYNYNGPPLALFVSNTYSGGLPASATWTQVPFAASTGSFVFVNSGAISLGAYKTNSARIAFRYTGTSSSGSTWEVDDIEVKEE